MTKHLRVNQSGSAKNKSQKSKNLKTHVHIVLDRSGSMSSCHQSTVSGFNEYLNTLRADKEGKYFVTLTQFDSDYSGPQIEETFSDLPLSKVCDLEMSDFQPRGMTPLLDAIGVSIIRTEKSVAKKRGMNAVVLVIITDGGENSSREFKNDAIANLIDRKEKDGWTVAYLGANQDAFTVGASMGFKLDKTMNYNTSHIQNTFKDLATTTVTRRALYDSNARGLAPNASEAEIKRAMANVASAAFFKDTDDAKS